MTSEVFLNASAAFLPFAPVDNEHIEAVLGMVGGQPSRARRLILKRNGIRTRHYAIDPATGQIAMSNAQLAAQAIRGLDLTGPVDCLAVGTSLADQLMPSHGVMVHGELGWPGLEVVSCAGICLSGLAALKHAWLNVRAGEAQRAVAAASELASAVMRAECFEPEIAARVAMLETQPEIAFEKDFLRWMLSDGAGAVLLEDRPRGALSLRVDWIEMGSAANELPACMYAGAAKNADDSLTGWAQIPPAQWSAHSVFAVKQDVRLLNEEIGPATLLRPLQRLIDKRGLRAEQIDWFLPHLSSYYFAEPMAAAIADMGFALPRERWFTNLASCGNTGSASFYIMLDALLRSGRLKRGQRLLGYVPESGRFSWGFIHMEVV